ncbi:MAG: tape measure protein [Methylococcaceae bacterium]|nr:tape measure protein [Methylococcaceae bacterium]
MANLEIKISAAVDGAKKSVESLSASFKQLKNSIKQSDDSGSNFAKTKTGLQSVSTQLSDTKKQLIGLFLGLPAIGGLKQLIQLAETAKVIDARIRIATKSLAEFTAAQESVRNISLKTGTALEANAGLFAKLRVNAGLASNEALKLTEIIAKATQLDGGGAGANAAIFQLQQGLASGTLRGQELNSVLEQTPSLAKALADGLGLNIGQMRKLAEEGGLSNLFKFFGGWVGLAVRL